MMTTADLKNRSLKTGIGYEKKDVDTFLDEIIASYEELYRSNVELNDRVNSLNEGLQHYKMIEASLQKTLVLAEKTAEETVNEAKEKAKQIEDEARGNTGRIALEAQQELDSILAKKNELAKSYNDMKAKMKAELTKYIADLDNEQYSCDAMETVSVNETVETVAAAKEEPKVEPKEEPKEESKVEPKVEAKVEPKEEPKVEEVVKEAVQSELEKKTAATENVVPQPAAAKFLKMNTPEVKEEVTPKEEPKSNDFAFNLGAGSGSTSTTEETQDQASADKENKLGINLGLTVEPDEVAEAVEDDSYEFEVEDSAFRSKRNANGQMLIGNDDEESGFEFLSEL